MNSIFKLFVREDRFFVLLEASAAAAQDSVKLLGEVVRQPERMVSMDEFIQTRRKDKRITEEISEALCKTFVTPFEREDIEALAIALYKIPKTIEKFSEKFLLCRNHLAGVDFLKQVTILEETTTSVVEMVRHLCKRTHLEQVKELNDRLHYFEAEADKIMVDLMRDLYSGRHETLKVIVVLDLYETLEKIIDRCRDAGNVMFQIVLKYS